MKRVILAITCVMFLILSTNILAATEKDLKDAASHLDRLASSQGEEEVIKRLSQQFNVSESIIKELRDQKLGFGEIGILLSLSQATGKPYSELLSRFKSGEGWGKIAKDEGVDLGRIVGDLKSCAKKVKSKEDKEDKGYGQGKGAERGHGPDRRGASRGKMGR